MVPKWKITNTYFTLKLGLNDDPGPRVRRYRDGLYPVKELNENAQRFMLRLLTAPYKYGLRGDYKRDLLNGVSKNYAISIHYL